MIGYLIIIHFLGGGGLQNAPLPQVSILKNYPSMLLHTGMPSLMPRDVANNRLSMIDNGDRTAAKSVTFF